MKQPCSRLCLSRAEEVRQWIGSSSRDAGIAILVARDLVWHLSLTERPSFTVFLLLALRRIVASVRSTNERLLTSIRPVCRLSIHG